MRAAAFLLALPLVGCGEPSFDERYRETEKSIRDKAAQIDAELAEKERQATAAVAPPTPAPSVTPRR